MLMIPAEIEHGQPVDLAHRAAIQIEQHRALVDLLQQHLLEQVDPVGAFLPALHHMFLADAVGAAALRPVGRLTHGVGNLGKARRQLAVVAGQPHALLDDRGHGIAMERKQPIVIDLLVDEAGVVAQLVVVARRVESELRLDLEDLLEVLVHRVEQAIDLGRPDHHDLDVDRRRLGLERDSGERVERIERLDLHLAVPQCPLQCGPDRRLDQHVDRVDDKNAAVGSKQAAGLDPRVIGAPLAIRGTDLVDRAEQVAVGRRGLPDDRRSSALAVVDHDVDLKTRADRRRLFTRRPGLTIVELAEVLEDILGQLIEVARDALDLERDAHLAGRLVDQRPGQLTI